MLVQHTYLYKQSQINIWEWHCHIFNCHFFFLLSRKGKRLKTTSSPNIVKTGLHTYKHTACVQSFIATSLQIQ
uniref:Uncharacterized protein n=1 Tax=Cannabis sativa TaxID=3483 RepID=A0A803RAW8_CANSA